MSSLGHDLRRAAQRLLAVPLFSLFAIVTLALAVGAATAVFSLVRAFTGPPPGVPDVDRVVEVLHFPQGSGPMMNLAWEDFEDLRKQQTVFEAITGWSWFRAAIVAGGSSVTGIGELTDGEYFRTLRAPMQIGRPLQPADDRMDAPPVAVISFALWTRAFRSAPDVLGKTIKVSGTTFEIVGVVGSEFTGLFNGGLLATAVWVPMHVGRAVFPERQEDFAPNARDHRWLFVRGRLAEGQTVEAADRQVKAIAKQLDGAYPIGRDLPPRFRTPFAVGRPWSVKPMASRMLGVPPQILRTFTWGVLGSVVLVLLVACTNLANLMVARHGARQTATAVRAALGASRRRLVVEAMIEPLVLAGLGGAAGLFVARLLMVAASAEIQVANGAAVLRVLPRLDLAAFAAAIGAMALSLLVAGVVPAVQAARNGIRSSLSRTTGGAAPRWRGRRYLIAAQVSVSVLFVALAALFGGELLRLSRIDTGVDLERLALAQINFGAQRYEPVRARQIADAAIAQVARRPGVSQVAITTGLPFGLNSAAGASLQTTAGASTVTPVRFVAGTAQMFETLGVQVLRGRSFDARDTSTSLPVIVLSRQAAESAFGPADPLGREVVFERRRAVGEVARPPKALIVVGVAEDTDVSSAGMRREGVAYLPLDQHYEDGFVLVARADGDPEPLAGYLRGAVASVDPDVVLANAGTGLSLAGPDTTFPRLMAGLGVSLGALALALSLGGLYGVMSYVVAGRTREIGIRLALGAGQRAIRRMVIVEGLSPVVLGLVAGIGFGLIARAGMQPAFLSILPAADATLLLLVPALFIGAGIGACHLPARRASRVDPNVALRDG